MAITLLAAVNERSRKMRNGRSGERARDSITMNASTNPIAVEKRAIVVAAPQPSVAARVAALKERGVTPGLGTVLVGDDVGSQKYVAGKHRDCAAVGIASIQRELPATASQEEIEAVVRELNEDPACTGYIVQLPLPRGIDAFRTFDLVYGLTGGGPGQSTTTLSFEAFQNGFSFFRYGYASAVAYFMVVIAAIGLTVLLRFVHLRREETA